MYKRCRCIHICYLLNRQITSHTTLMTDKTCMLCIITMVHLPIIDAHYLSFSLHYSVDLIDKNVHYTAQYGSSCISKYYYHTVFIYGYLSTDPAREHRKHPQRRWRHSFMLLGDNFYIYDIPRKLLHKTRCRLVLLRL